MACFSDFRGSVLLSRKLMLWPVFQISEGIGRCRFAVTETHAVAVFQIFVGLG